MAYTLSNTFAKNLSKRAVLVQLIVKNVVTCFLEHNVDVHGHYHVCFKHFTYHFYIKI